MKNNESIAILKTKKTTFYLITFSIIILTLCVYARDLNIKAKETLDGLSSCHKYLFSAMTKDNKEHELICFEGDTSFDKDFIINYKQNTYTQIKLKSVGSVNTTNPIGCVDMSYKSQLEDNADTIKQNGTAIKISVIGNDYISGDGVRAQKRFPNVITEAGKNKKKRFNVRSYNGGSYIKDIFQKNFKQAIKSDSVEILYVITLGDMPVYIKTKEYFYEPREGVFTSPVLPPQKRHFLLYDYIYYIMDIQYEQTRESIWLKSRYSHMNYAGTEEFKEYLRKMKKESAEGGKKFSCAIFPYIIGDYDDYPFKEIHNYLMDILKSEHIPSIDLFAPLFSNEQRGRWVSRCDYHPGPESHEKAGRILYDFLSKHQNDTSIK